MKIAQFNGHPTAWGSITPTTMKTKGVGGRETALIMLSEHWAQAGHEVINFVHVNDPEHHRHGDGKASYVHHSLAGEYLSTFEVDVAISWDNSMIFELPDVARNVQLKVVEMQCAHLNNTAEANENIDVYAVLSAWAGRFLAQQDNIDVSKIEVLPNGVDLSRFPEPQYNFPQKGGPYEFFYSSSPDRGLHHVLNVWPRIQYLWPGSQLHIAYGVEHWVESAVYSHSIQAETALSVREGLLQEGVVYHGKIGQDVLAAIQCRSDALLYPCDTMQPTETGCITVIEAGAACTPAIITNADCLESEFSHSARMVKLPLNYDEYMYAIEEVMNDAKLYTDLQHKGRLLAESRSWGKIAAQWLGMFDRHLAKIPA